MPEKLNIEPATPELAAKDTFRIVILDDIKHVNQLKIACKNAGHSVVPAHTVRQAMSFLDTKNHADVIICAAYLEDEDIFKFLKALRANPVHNKSMFMILALAPGPVGVHLNRTVEIAGHQLGADAFISMPVFDAEVLIAEIKKLLPTTPWLERSRLDDEMLHKNGVSE
jgi:CheY-like chemotaxis protein